MRTISDSLNYRKHELVAQGLERWPRSPSHGICSPTFCGSSWNFDRRQSDQPRKAFVRYAGTVVLSWFGRKSAKSPIDFARNFCLDVMDFSPMQQSQPALVAVSRMLSKSRVERASRSRRVTMSTSPEPSLARTRRNCVRSVLAPLAVSWVIVSAPAAGNWRTCASTLWPSVVTAHQA